MKNSPKLQKVSYYRSILLNPQQRFKNRSEALNCLKIQARSGSMSALVTIKRALAKYRGKFYDEIVDALIEVMENVSNVSSRYMHEVKSFIQNPILTDKDFYLQGLGLELIKQHALKKCNSALFLLTVLIHDFEDYSLEILDFLSENLELVDALYEFPTIYFTTYLSVELLDKLYEYGQNRQSWERAYMEDKMLYDGAGVIVKKRYIIQQLIGSNIY